MFVFGCSERRITLFIGEAVCLCLLGDENAFQVYSIKIFPPGLKVLLQRETAQKREEIGKWTLLPGKHSSDFFVF